MKAVRGILAAVILSCSPLALATEALELMRKTDDHPQSFQVYQPEAYQLAISQFKKLALACGEDMTDKQIAQMAQDKVLRIHKGYKYGVRPTTITILNDGIKIMAIAVTYQQKSERSPPLRLMEEYTKRLILLAANGPNVNLWGKQAIAEKVITRGIMSKSGAKPKKPGVKPNGTRH